MNKLILVPVAAAAAFILGGVQHASASESWYSDEDGDLRLRHAQPRHVG